MISRRTCHPMFVLRYIIIVIIIIIITIINIIIIISSSSTLLILIWVLSLLLLLLVVVVIAAAAVIVVSSVCVLRHLRGRSLVVVRAQNGIMKWLYYIISCHMYYITLCAIL